jgi:hypothetical protein
MSTEEEEHFRRPTEVAVPENVDAIHSKILDNQRISPKEDSREPGDIPRKSGLYYLQDFRHEKALSQMDSQMSHCWSAA